MSNFYLLLFSASLLFVTSCQEKKVKIIVEKEIEAQQIPTYVSFPAPDEVPISALLYHHSKQAPVILLCHQARFNKMEYKEIALTLFENGFNCLAIDQRSGGPMEDSLNGTQVAAEKLGKSTDFLSAEQDIEAGITYLEKKYNKKVILWGSSYSATLALYQALQNEHLKAAVCFSPGNYLSAKKGDLRVLLAELNKPVFITSSKAETPDLEHLLKHHKHSKFIYHFKPLMAGEHGSKTLWKSQPGHSEYWDALTHFLTQLKEMKELN